MTTARRWERERVGRIAVAAAAVAVSGLLVGVAEVGAQTYTLSFDGDTVAEGGPATGVKVTVTRRPGLASDDTDEYGYVKVSTLTPFKAAVAADIVLTPDAAKAFPKSATTTAGMTSAVSWVLTAMDDTEIEGDEELILDAVMGSTANAAVDSPDALDSESVTITDNDDPSVGSLVLSVAPTTLKEDDDEDDREAKVTVKSPAGTFTTSQTISLVLGGDAMEDDDYTIKAKSLALEPGKAKVETTLTALDDQIYDGPVPETVRVSAFVGSTQLGGTNGTKVITIEDNDQNPDDFSLMASPAAIEEGEVATITITAKTAPAADTTFMLMVAGTASRNTDYTVPSELMVTKGTTMGSVQVQAIADTISEADETVMITVTVGGVMIGTATVTIMDAMTPTPALPVFGAFALAAGLVAAGRRRLRVRRRALLKS
jgi:hypothetical protein